MLIPQRHENKESTDDGILNLITPKIISGQCSKSV